MYTPPAFREDDPAILASIMAAARLSLLVSNGADGLPMITHLPLQYRGGPGGAMVIGHIARANPHWHGLERGVAVFQGVEGYVSPSSYPSKAEHHRVVPTWNYEAVHAHGTIEVVQDAGRLREIVAGLTDAHEAKRAQPWSVDDAPAEFVAGQLKGIVGVVLRVERLIGKRKLSQNRSAADAGGAADDLAARADARDRAVAAAMRG
jgi:transcriptional regulator